VEAEFFLFASVINGGLRRVETETNEPIPVSLRSLLLYPPLSYPSNIWLPHISSPIYPLHTSTPTTPPLLLPTQSPANYLLLRRHFSSRQEGLQPNGITLAQQSVGAPEPALPLVHTRRRRFPFGIPRHLIENG